MLRHQLLAPRPQVHRAMGPHSFYLLSVQPFFELLRVNT